MRLRCREFALLALVTVCSGFILACSDDDDGATRTVSGTLSGDLTNVSSLVATGTNSGATSSVNLSALSQPGMLSNAAVSPATYALDLAVGESYNIALADANGNVVAVMEWSTSATGTTTTTVFNLTPGATIDLGDSGVPVGADATVITLISSTNNPLEDTDSDGDGSSDYDDSDDDNDGIDDDQDSDDDGDGVDDEAEESDSDDDGIPDTEDADSEDADNDDDGVDDDTDDDDDNDGIDDDIDDDDDGDGIPDTEEV
jgi:hypothetical protein